MDNELIVNQNWIKRHWKWVLPMTILLILFFILLIPSTSKSDLTNIVQAYNETSLFDDAITIANKNKRVLETVGKIEQIDKLAILEGSAVYTNNNKSVEASVRIRGAKGNGKLDISAYKKEGWNYQKIIVRLKNPKEEIKIVD